MNNKKRITLISLACLLALTLVVGGTLAWLTDTDGVDNKIKIATIGTTPEEPNWPGDPEDPDDPPVPVYPGVPQAKDPTITIDEGSEPVYVRAVVKVSTDMLAALQEGTGVTFKAKDNSDLTGAAMPSCNEDWTLANTEVVGDYTYLEYRYANVLSNATDGTKATSPVFTGFQLKSSITADDMEEVDMDISVKSQAIQAAGFTDNTALAQLGTPASAFGEEPSTT